MHMCLCSQAFLSGTLRAPPKYSQSPQKLMLFKVNTVPYCTLSHSGLSEFNYDSEHLLEVVALGLVIISYCFITGQVESKTQRENN